MSVRIAVAALIVLTLVVAVWASAPTTINDFTLPGSQPGQSGTILTSSNCNCHSGYDKAVEPMFNWEGSMMAQAARDMLFWATMSVANQDAPESGDLCIRCHSPKGWLEGRSSPTDGSALIADDRDGITCNFCHRLVEPSPLGVNPHPDDPDYTSGTYLADSTYLSILAHIPPMSGNGAYIVDSQEIRRGPYTNPDAPHVFHYSPFHREAAICGTCHDVSNPVFTRTATGDYVPNSFDTPTPDFSTYTMYPVERTYSEWLMSDYNTPEGVYAPQFGGNLDTVRTCQDCHMHDVTGKGCKRGSAPTRTDLGMHDLMGGNTFMGLTIDDAFSGDRVNTEAIDSAIQRAKRMVEAASSMSLNNTDNGSTHEVTVTLTNETGHKLPSGYPEGRRMWINIRAYDSLGSLIYESGAYDTSTAVLTHDADVKIYQIKPGISNSLAATLSLTAGPSFHFVLNDSVYSDNRIPPRGFTNANFDSIQSPPVAYSYVDGQYWDDTQYPVPGAAAKVVVTQYYQTTSKEYVEFLRDENTTDTMGTKLYDLWQTYGKSLPVIMNSDSLILTPIEGNSNHPPVLAAIGSKSTDEGVNLTFGVSATDAEDPAPDLTMSTLPTGANFTDNGDGTGSFSWTPNFDQAGTYDLTFYATDDSSAVDSERVTITVNNVNRIPELAAIGSKTIDENVNLSFGVSATDPDGNPLTLTAAPLPTGANFTDNGDGTGNFSWTPTYDQAGIYNILFVVSDGIAADSESVPISVNDVNRIPVLAAIGSQTIDENVNLSFGVSATDPDGNPLTLTAAPLPTGADFTDNGDGTGSFSWTPTYDQAELYNILFIASDGFAADSESVQITVNNVNRPPVLAAIGNKAVLENSLLSFAVTATDPDGTIPSLSTSTLPSGANFTDNHDGSGSFSWTPTSGQSGIYPVTFYAVDDSAAVDSEAITITVTDVNNAPVLATIGSKEVDENVLLSFTVSATDADSDPLALTAAPLPAGASFTDNGDGTGDFNWTPTYEQSGGYDVLFVVSDGIAADSESVLITVNNVNRPPTIDPVDPQFVVEGELLSFMVYAFDIDGDSVGLYAQNLPDGATFVDMGWSALDTKYYGVFEFTPTVGQAGVYADVSFIATDLMDTDTAITSITVTSSSCCIGLTGNVDGDELDVVDIGDLTALIGYLFIPPYTPPDCMEEANCDGEGGVDIGDLTALIGYLFIPPYTPPATCQ